MTARSNYQAHIPDGVRALAGVYSYISHSGLPKTLVDLCYLRASQINGCAYCIDAHTHELMKAGEALQKLLLISVWREAGGWFTERERIALAWTETVTRISDTHAPDADYAAAAAMFNDKELADLTLAIGLINVYNRVAISFRREPDSLRLAPEAAQ